MASRVSRHQCSICLESFIKPKILPCFHSFCEKCLEDYVKSNAYGKRFNCPNCRKKIPVPKGGVGKFSLNFYLEDSDVENPVYVEESGPSKRYCTTHTGKEIEMYCKDCSEAICRSCCDSPRHRYHIKGSLLDMETEIRRELTSLQLELKQKIKRLESRSLLLENILKTQEDASFKACRIIDQQVEGICSRVRGIGKKFKEKVTKLQKVENEKFEELHNELKRLRDRLEVGLESSRHVLEDESILHVVDAIPKITALKQDGGPDEQDLPETCVPEFSSGEIDVSSLKKLLGCLQIHHERTLTACFDVDEMLRKDVDTDSEEFTIGNLPWHISARHESRTDTLGIYLRVENGIPSNVHWKIKLVHPEDNKKSIVRDNDYVPIFYKWSSAIFGSERGWSFLPWNELTQYYNGWIEDDKFTVKATVKVTTKA